VKPTRANSPLARRWQIQRLCLCGLSLLLAVGAGCGGGGGGSSRAVTRLSGLVAEIDTGSPVIGAQVTVDGTTRGTTTTVRGSYFLDDVDVPRGWRTVRAQKLIGGQSWTGQRAVLFDSNVNVQSNLLITVAPASRQGTIRGRVTSASSVPLRNVTVFLNPDTSVAAAYQITDSNGSYQFPNVPAGTYSVVASASGLVNAPANQVSLTAGSTVTVNLSMLISSSTSITAPANLAASALTYPEETAGTQAAVRAVQRWLRARHGTPRKWQRSSRVRVQDWPIGSIIEADLDWTPPSANDLAGYLLDRAVGTGAFGTIDQFADPTASAYYDLDPIYTPDQTYQFRLSAASTTGFQSGPSNTASVRPLAPMTGLTPANGAQQVTAPPTFTWQAVSRAQRYQVLVLSRLPDLSDITQMPLVWPPANTLTAAQTASTQLTYAGPALQSGTTYYWLVFAADQTDVTTAPAVSTSAIQSFTVR
jgi:hypothetical protein